MTDQAQMEIMKIIDIVIQSDTTAIKECKTLNKVWAKCLNHDVNTSNVVGAVKGNLLKNDKCMMVAIYYVEKPVLNSLKVDIRDLFTLISHFFKSFSNAPYRLQNALKIVCYESIIKTCEYFTYIHSITDNRK